VFLLRRLSYAGGSSLFGVEFTLVCLFGLVVDRRGSKCVASSGTTSSLFIKSLSLISTTFDFFFENCENKLRHFIYQEMKIPERIEFGNIHRFGKMNSERPRPIIARFLYYSDLDKAKKVLCRWVVSLE
jgi:hypothetical protein